MCWSVVARAVQGIGELFDAISREFFSLAHVNAGQEVGMQLDQQDRSQALAECRIELIDMATLVRAHAGHGNSTFRLPCPLMIIGSGPYGKLAMVSAPLSVMMTMSGSRQYPLSQIPGTSDRRGRSERQAVARRRCGCIVERRQRTGRPGSATQRAAENACRGRRTVLAMGHIAGDRAPARQAFWAVVRTRDLR